MAPQTRSSTARLSQAPSLPTSRADDGIKTKTISCHQPSEAPGEFDIPETREDSEDLEDIDSEDLEDLDPDDPDDTVAPGKSSHNNLRLDLQPITNAHQAFKDLLSKRVPQITAIAEKGGFQLRVGTICSGTEAPIFALKLIKDISQLLPGVNGQIFMQFDHLFSVEIEPFKQAYISRNAPGSIVFRDVVDFTDPEATAAPTILGDHREIPRNIDLLVAGTSCVDFSTLNTKKKKVMQTMTTGADLVEEWKNSDQNPANNKTAKKKPADNKPIEKKPVAKKSVKKSDEENPAKPLREDFFHDFRQWLSSITPAEIQTTGDMMGESSITFLSTVCYINRHRPKMVILENVKNAPWDSMCGLFLRAIDYAATHTLLDTKDYYIPHTRTRGYVVALDLQVFGNSAEHVLVEWRTQLASLERGASAPVQDWLLSSQDPLTIRARQDESEKAVTGGLNSGRDSQWERSKLRHARVRRQFKLGNGRPLTAWGRGGIEQPYDRIDRLIIKGQNNRALDCVDIYYLRCLHAESQAVTNSTKKIKKTPAGPMQYDIRFKSQIFDLSQNIDRGQITHNFGVTGCLTPRGMNLITDQGRLVSGFEALNLQGLPLRDLDLSRETQDELRDLAGNAMTTTVVGAALFSLLIAVDLHSSKANLRPLGPIITMEQTIVPYQPLYQPPFTKYAPQENFSTDLEPFHNVQEVIDISKRCRRYCYCNGGAKYSTDELVRCQICNVTRCTSCAGNPSHRFGSLLSIKNPIMNDTAPGEMMKYFPTALKNVISETIDRISFHPGLQNAKLQRDFLLSLRTTTFYYTQVLLSENVTICYTAKNDNCSFRLQAVVSDRWVTWYLFLDPWSPCGKLLSESLSLSAAQMLRPFGRLRVHSRALGFLPIQDAWEFWVFTEIPFNINITKPRPDSIEIEGIPEGIPLAKIPAETLAELRSIVGTYHHHPECDAAEDSLHANVQGPKRYLFKDTTRIGLTQDDCYVISDECRYLEKHEFRDFCVKFLPEWTPQAAETRATVSIKGYWAKAVASTRQIQAPPESSLANYTRHVGFRSVPSHTQLQSNAVDQRICTLASVCVDSNMLADTYITLLKYKQNDTDDWAVVSRSDYSALFDLLAPVNVNLDGIETEITTDIRNLCYPSLPKVHWMEKNTGGAGGAIRDPYRLSSEMRVYEERLQRCCEPFQVAVNITDSKNKQGWKTVTANYEVNVDLLVQGALHHFPKPKDSSGEVFEVKTRMQIKKGSLNIPNLRFEPFQKSLKRLLGNDSQDGIELPKLFIQGHALTKQQEISLSWMLGRELNPPPFSEREIEECRSDPLNLRILAVAERDISHPGGILADEVGYGKTVVSLALMAAQQSFDQKESLQKRGNQEDTLALAASLVLVPRHLVNQWCDEAAKFLDWKGPDVLVIRSSRSLHGMLNRTESDGVVTPPPPKRPRTTKKSVTLLDKLKAAKLIIVSTAVFDDKYYTWLGKYAGSLAHPLAIPRTRSTRDTTNPNVLGAFQDWYEDTVTYARNHVSGFDPAIFRLNRLEIIEQRQKSLQDSWTNVVADHYDTSTRLGLQTIRGDKTGKSVKGSEEEAIVHKEYNNTARANHFTEEDFRANNLMHVLEAFSYARVIYDEFSYQNFCVALFIKNAKAHAKWVLSATPPTSNVKAVCDIGELLSIHVARAVKLRPGLPLITEGPIVLRQNPTEKQLSYGKLYTDQSVYERVEQAHKFIQHFASANPFDEEGLGKIEVSEKAYCSYMTRHQLLKYLDIQQELRSSNLDISNLLKRHNIDSDIMAEFPSEGRLRAGLALAYAASVDCTDDDSDIDKLRSHRREKLKEAQKKLKDITEVAIWLVLRRSEEVVKKKNDSATSGVEDLAWHFGSILEADAEVFGGAEALEAVTDSTFTKEQFAACSEWFKDVNTNERNSEGFFKDFFTLLDEQMKPSAWATYFRLSADRIASLHDSEVSDRIQELCGNEPGPLTPNQARQRLRELVASRQPQLQETKNGPKITKRKGRARPSDEDAEDTDSSKPNYPRFNARIKIRGGDYTETESELTNIVLKLTEVKEDILTRAKQVTTASNLLCKDEARGCSACGYSGEEMRFLPECGHFVCSRHPEVKICGQIKSEKFPNGSGCSALLPQRSIPVKQIDRCPMGTDEKLPKANPKSLTICRTIRDILNRSDDSILVFYQFDEQKQEICHLLEHDRIAFDDRSGVETDTPAAPASQRVRILKLNSEEAAGSNFQDANHVLFVSTPVFGKQEEFEKYVKQAKGRVVRHGQLKPVKVYYFITVNTFEVDLLQLRKKSHVRLEEGDIACFAPWSGDKHHHSTDSEGDVDMTDAPTVDTSS
ncbi:hypothetical protein EV127DRAFT_19041 [Xylaria flabelliformis]|nr:hypothetical protein EV127DRAFT_19041 [Xylaria flabelliformis]